MAKMLQDAKAMLSFPQHVHSYTMFLLTKYEYSEALVN